MKKILKLQKLSSYNGSQAAAVMSALSVLTCEGGHGGASRASLLLC